MIQATIIFCLNYCKKLQTDLPAFYLCPPFDLFPTHQAYLSFKTNVFLNTLPITTEHFPGINSFLLSQANDLSKCLKHPIISYWLHSGFNLMLYYGRFLFSPLKFVISLINIILCFHSALQLACVCVCVSKHHACSPTHLNHSNIWSIHES